MTAPGQFYTRRSRTPSVGVAGRSSDSAGVLSAAARTADPSPVVATISARRRRSPECNLVVKRTSLRNASKLTLSSEAEGRTSDEKRLRKLVKVKDSGCSSSGVKSSHNEVDIEDVPPLTAYRFTEEEASSIKASLLSWYDENHRLLPWRQHPSDSLENQVDGEVEEGRCMKEESVSLSHELHSKGGGKGSKKSSKQGAKFEQRTTDVTRSIEMEEQRAYEVWVSEMMLQQTRVATVIEYYRRWMERWPSLHHLAQASQEEVNTVWAGLGYYRRARFLLEGAKQIVERGSGFPRSVKELQKVPGIGEYTSGAIASICFQQPVPVVDGNVVRVLSRLRAITENPKLPSTVRIHWALAEELVDARRPGDLNQSLMELGATVCKPSSPDCSFCPVSTHCKALSLESKSVKAVTDFPVKVAKVQPRDEYVAVCIVVVMNRKNVGNLVDGNFSAADSHILLVQRPPQGLLAGLWEFPLVSVGGTAVQSKEQKAAMNEYLQSSLGFNLQRRGNFSTERREHVGTYVHIFSHIKMHMSIEWLLLCPSESQWERKSMDGKQGSISMKWVQADKVGNLGLTSSVKKIFSMFLNHMKQHKTPKQKRLKP
ncbi:hypothetical protein R1flu_019843 [Riccia fluitans]|uniref:Adenine DNA glycosylase n=1 Tax=Riccia fluitans TaxID=41844 RepID=A0ABD1ZK55_9MARC